MGLNALLNDLHDCPVTNDSFVTVAAEPLAWADPPPLPFAARLLLGSANARGPLDTLLLADVIYDPDLYAPLVATLRALVPHAATPAQPPQSPAVVLAYRHRNPEDFRFWAVLHAGGFDAAVARAAAAAISSDGPVLSDVVVYRLVRARAGAGDLAAVAAAAEKPSGPPGPVLPKYPQDANPTSM